MYNFIKIYIVRVLYDNYRRSSHYLMTIIAWLGFDADMEVHIGRRALHVLTRRPPQELFEGRCIWGRWVVEKGKGRIQGVLLYRPFHFMPMARCSLSLPPYEQGWWHTKTTSPPIKTSNGFGLLQENSKVIIASSSSFT